MNAIRTSNQNEDKIFTTDFFLIFGALLFSALVMYALMSTVTEYARSMGTSATIAGLVSGIYIFGGLCSRIYSANALEKRDWKKLAIVFLSIHFLACIFYFFANNVTLLLIVRFIHGLGFGASANAIVTIASAILPKKRFGEAFGYFMLGTTIAVGLGPYVSGFFYDNWGSFGSFSLATSFAFLGLLCILLLDISKYEIMHNSEIENTIEEDREELSLEEKGTFRSFIDKIFEIPAIPVSLFTGLTSLGYVSILSFYRLYAVEVDLVSAFSLFFIIYSIVLVASRPIAGRIQDNYGDRIVCFTGIIAQAIGLFLIAWMPSAITVFICAVCAALGFGTLNSACTAIVTRDTSANRVLMQYQHSLFSVMELWDSALHC
ncbi:MAG: MFS transporter [Methanobrevibacter ruminantium]|uniref:MFS transporter n=1 Tax=Methanobrevibacter ruminantium TaxID=83816 RepID=UPI0026F18C9C|nr:MFS transporter [Methanobrevibacter ruminantium]MCI5737973.1 MFS transporter [Methanobrevibacter ruminantium]MDD6049310.1 MFS transporter [Methanobrevibacter ruminantium]